MGELREWMKLSSVQVVFGGGWVYVAETTDNGFFIVLVVIIIFAAAAAAAATVKFGVVAGSSRIGSACSVEGVLFSPHQRGTRRGDAVAVVRLRWIFSKKRRSRKTDLTRVIQARNT